jgi:hypothetical protein
LKVFEIFQKQRKNCIQTRNFARCSAQKIRRAWTNGVFEMIESSFGIIFFILKLSSWEQKCVGVVFATVIVLWTTRELHAVPGAKLYHIYNQL